MRRRNKPTPEEKKQRMKIYKARWDRENREHNADYKSRYKLKQRAASLDWGAINPSRKVRYEG